MRFTPWLTTAGLAVALMLGSSAIVHADDDHEPMDDAALEEEYGIKAGSLIRHEDDSDEQESGEAANNNENDEEESPEAGTGGSGSPGDAHNGSEDEQDDEESDAENGDDD